MLALMLKLHHQFACPCDHQGSEPFISSDHAFCACPHRVCVCAPRRPDHKGKGMYPGLHRVWGMKVHHKPVAHAMTVRKKPAAQATKAHTQPATSVEQPVLYEPHSDIEPEVAARPMQDWTVPPPMPSQGCRPCWASHVVRVLQEHGHLPSTKQGRALSLTLSSDCSSINSELFALSEIGKALHEAIGTSVSWNLYFACDSDRRCLKFADLNFQPQHTSAAIENRHFETGKI